MLLGTLLDLYSLVIVAAVVLSWTQLPPSHPVVQFVDMLTAPVLAPIRRMIPTVGGLDLSPMVLLIGLQLLRQLFMI